MVVPFKIWFEGQRWRIDWGGGISDKDLVLAPGHNLTSSFASLCYCPSWKRSIEVPINFIFALQRCGTKLIDNVSGFGRAVRWSFDSYKAMEIATKNGSKIRC